MLLIFSVISIHQFIDLTFNGFSLALALPLLIGAVGVFLNFLIGELDRKRLIDNAKSYRTYKATFYLTFGMMIFAVILGAIMNPKAIVSSVNELPYIALGIAILICIAYAILIYSSRGFSKDSKKEPLIV
jgi:cytochrome bd-type quinol oxidase subunit 2